MLGYDEIRQMNSCASCRAKNMTAGQLLAWSVGRDCQDVLRGCSRATALHLERHVRSEAQCS